MKFIIFFIYIPLVQSELHRFITTYTGIRGEKIAGTPEFSAVTTLDDQQIDYYDSNIQKLIPKQDWMKKFASEELRNRYTHIRNHEQQICKYNIPVIMQEFNQSHGLHTYQRMYGCVWDDETEETQGFDQHAYDGEDFISLDLREFRYITPVQQGLITTQKWNNDKQQLESLKRYYDTECVEWLKEFWRLRKAYVERRAPQVSLLRKNPSSPVVCHATGFYPSGITITWLRNGVDQYEDVDLGETLPNEDGTFQKTSTLRVPPDEWEKNEFTCVVEHQEKTIQKTHDEIKSNSKSYSTILACAMGLFILVIGVAVWIRHKKRTHGFQPVPCDDDGSNYADFIFIDKGL